MLLDHETQKLNELEASYQAELKEWKSNLRRRKEVKQRISVNSVHYNFRWLWLKTLQTPISLVVYR